ncbi:hypothetical protein [Corynebacterium pelargi]|uniref:Uncharacterized protein n=1 Tax=Corynebacterium pelargi TaxID=1471400 RepID=A0A410WAR4_9CORY|nr:hypothetical protein [Corynebacterium pelargi]QAU53047.1 hypothetical protein CPELA_08960 [Corynebacterium pelargi]GGG75220.1 hypothetical protein GCM10007338_10930 [Corynebacterium pelargi]
MSYEDYIADFRKRTAQRVADFEKLVREAEAAVQAAKHKTADASPVQPQATTKPRKRGRVRGILHSS